MSRSDGSTASYYELPEGCSELQELISHRDMNAQIGEIFRACYRYGIADHSDRLRDAKKMRFYAEAEINRLEKLQKAKDEEAVTEFFKDALAKTLEPAAQIDDESPRTQAVAQNGNTAEHYHWKAVDGKWSPFVSQPEFPIDILHRDGSMTIGIDNVVLLENDNQGYWKHSNNGTDIVAWRYTE